MGCCRTSGNCSIAPADYSTTYNNHDSDSGTTIVAVTFGGGGTSKSAYNKRRIAYLKKPWVIANSGLHFMFRRDLPLIEDDGNDGRHVGNGNVTIAISIGSKLIDACGLPT